MTPEPLGTITINAPLLPMYQQLAEPETASRLFQIDRAGLARTDRRDVDPLPPGPMSGRPGPLDNPYPAIGGQLRPDG